MDRTLIPNANALIESLRSIGYNFESAISDLIDNSISAGAENIHINFEFDPNLKLSIFDDGHGMHQEELIDAMRFGSQDPTIQRERSDLGRFGLGLKSASLSQCKKLTVISKKGSLISGASWDLDYIKQVQDWKIKLLDQNSIHEINNLHKHELDNTKHGTVVVWSNFDRFDFRSADFRKSFLDTISALETHLSLVFHRFLERDKNKLNIFINGHQIKPNDPFLRSNLSTQKKETQIKKIDDEKIYVTPYILPHLNKLSREEISSLGGKQNLKQNQGYYIYRNQRLIIWGKWFNQYPKEELAKLVRVQVDIPNTLDYLWEIDVKKSQAVIPAVIKKNLGMMINESLNSGKKVFRYKGKPKNRSSLIKVWNRIEERDYIRYEINQNHPLIENLLTKNPSSKDQIISIFKMIQSNIPSYQLYLDEAENIKEISTRDIFDSQNFKNLIKVIDDLDEAQVSKFLENIDLIEGLGLTDEEKEKLIRHINNILSHG
jgi:hypothetical protein